MHHNAGYQTTFAPTAALYVTMHDARLISEVTFAPKAALYVTMHDARLISDNICRSNKNGILGAAPSRSLVTVRYLFEDSFMIILTLKG